MTARRAAHLILTSFSSLSAILWVKRSERRSRGWALRAALVMSDNPLTRAALFPTCDRRHRKLYTVDIGSRAVHERWRSTMHIVCTTTEAAAEVLSVLLSADQHPIQHFVIEPVFAPTPPITFIVLAVLPVALVQHIGALADTTIIG